jgi:hypothetical protein
MAKARKSASGGNGLPKGSVKQFKIRAASTPPSKNALEKNNLGLLAITEQIRQTLLLANSSTNRSTKSRANISLPMDPSPNLHDPVKSLRRYFSFQDIVEPGRAKVEETPVQKSRKTKL